MGKGTIISGGAGGLYQVQINYNRTRYDAQIARFSTLRAALVIASTEELDARKKALIDLQILSIDKATIFLVASMPDDVTVPAWCVDLTEDLIGVVGTFEVPGELIRLQIRPGYGGDAPYDATRDGQIMPTVSQDYAQAYYNLAMLPGWQKWKPLTRYATISEVSGNTASVTLDGETSSQQGLVINQSTTLSGVAIDYMDCHGRAFEVGDEVLVIFTGQDWDAPKIVGFKDNPRSCGTAVFIQFKMITGSGIKTECCVVWDVGLDSYRANVRDNSGDLVTFPVKTSDISDWLARQSAGGDYAVRIQDEFPPDPPNFSGLDITETVTSITSPADCTPTEPCDITSQAGSDSIGYYGTDYLGVVNHTAFRTLEGAVKSHSSVSYIAESTKTYDAPTRGYDSSGFIIISATNAGGNRARTASLEHTEEFYSNDCGQRGSGPAGPFNPYWPCAGEGTIQTTDITNEYEFKSPFEDLSTRDFIIATSEYLKVQQDGATVTFCEMHTNAEDFQDEVYEVGSIKSDEVMVVFYFEEIIAINTITPCAHSAHLYLQCIGGDVGACIATGPDTTTYEKKIEFNIRAFTHLVEESESVEDVNPFEILESTGLGAALEGLKDFAESFSGEPDEDEATKIDYEISILT